MAGRIQGKLLSSFTICKVDEGANAVLRFIMSMSRYTYMSVSIGKACKKKCDLDPLDAANLLSSKSDQPFLFFVCEI
jgi:hypothetical protein